MDEIYLDHHTKTRVHKESLQTFLFHAERFCQASGPKGAEGALRLQRASEAILARLGASQEDRLYLFTDLLDAMQILLQSHYLHEVRQTGKNHVLCSRLSEQGVLQAFRQLESLGCVCKFIDLSESIPVVTENLDLGPGQSPGDGRLHLACIGDTGDDAIVPSSGGFAPVRNRIFSDDRYIPISPRTSLVSISLSDRWQGVIQRVEEITKICQQAGVLLHVDVSAAIGKIPIEFTSWGIDFLTADGSCFGAPSGIACLVAKKGTSFVLARENPLPMVAAFASALEESIDRIDLMQLEIASRRALFEETVCRDCKDAKVLFSSSHRLPNVSCLSFPGIHSELLLFYLRQEKVYATCMQDAISFVLSWETTEEEVLRSAHLIGKIVKKLEQVRYISPGSETWNSVIFPMPHTKKFADALQHLRHAGTFFAKDAESKSMRAISTDVGGSVHLSLLIDETDGVIADAKFQAYGPPLLVATFEIVCGFLVRKSVAQMAKMTAEILEKQLQDPGVPLQKEVGLYVNLVIEAFESLEMQCQDLIDKHFEPVTPLISTRSDKKSYPGWNLLSKGEKMEIIEEVIATDIRPYIELDEGGITLVDVLEHEVIISYQGACTTCYSSVGSTLQAIQGILQDKVHSALRVRPDTSLFHSPIG